MGRQWQKLGHNSGATAGQDPSTFRPAQPSCCQRFVVRGAGLRPLAGRRTGRLQGNTGERLARAPAHRSRMGKGGAWNRWARVPWGDTADPEKANYAATNLNTTSAVGCFLPAPARTTWKSYPAMSGNGQAASYMAYPYDPMKPGQERENLAAPPEKPVCCAAVRTTFKMYQRARGGPLLRSIRTTGALCRFSVGGVPITSVLCPSGRWTLIFWYSGRRCRRAQRLLPCNTAAGGRIFSLGWQAPQNVPATSLFLGGTHHGRR